MYWSLSFPLCDCCPALFSGLPAPLNGTFLRLFSILISLLRQHCHQIVIILSAQSHVRRQAL
jgi:hypothetical protein